MKKSIFCLLFILFLFYPYLFAQTVKIVNVRGKVVLKKAPSYSWEKAEVDICLDAKAEIKTGQYSECTLAFAEDLQNALLNQVTCSLVIPGFEGMIDRFELKTVALEPLAGATV